MGRVRPVRVMSVLGAVVMLTSCTAGGGSETGPGSPGGPWEAEFEQARADATTDFERDVLADGDITTEEIEEARDRMVQCAADQGVEVTWEYVAPNTANYNVRGGDADAAVFEECQQTTLWVLDPLYASITSDPNHEGYSAIFAECFVRHGLVPEGFTADDVDDWFEETAVDPETGQRANPTATPDPESDEVTQCLINPTG